MRIPSPSTTSTSSMTPAETIGVRHLDHLNLSVTDLDASLAWYAAVFEFSPVERGLYEGRPWAIVRAGDALLCLYERPQLERPDNADRCARGLHGVNHFALRITEVAPWEARVARLGLELLYGGRRSWPHSDSWYVADPTGYEIEVTCWRGDQVRFG